MFGLSTVISKLNLILATLSAAGGVTITPQTLSAANDTVAAGLYEATTLRAVDADLATANIKSGITIFGIAGKAEVVDTTIAADFVIAGRMKTGDKAYTNGSLITGDGTKTLSAANSTVTAGYYAATTLEAVDTDLATINIKAGVTIFGKTGSATVVDVSDTTAVAGDVATGKIFYLANGSQEVGAA
jgi:hypothetical protein